MDFFTESLGIIHAGDVVSLAPRLQVRQRMLFDHANGARHIISGKARDVLNVLGKGIEVSQWYAYSIASGLTDSEWMELIDFLNSIGGIAIRRTRKAQVQIIVQRTRWRLQGVTLQSHASRFPATHRGIAIAVSQAMSQLAVLTIFVSMLSIIAGMPSYALLSLFCISILWFTTIVHEYMHVVISKSSNHTPVIIVRGLRLGIVHHQLSRKRNILSALMGPLMGIVSAAILGLIGWAIDAHVVAEASRVVCIFHAASWLPSYGDGQALSKEITSFRKGHSYEKTTTTSTQRRRTTGPA